jgi:hypothetical protein
MNGLAASSAVVVTPGAVLSRRGRAERSDVPTLAEWYLTHEGTRRSQP